MKNNADIIEQIKTDLAQCSGVLTCVSATLNAAQTDTPASLALWMVENKINQSIRRCERIGQALVKGDRHA